ncbi:hypothetical protein ACQ4PT_063482 [Festuca glaucescens]
MAAEPWAKFFWERFNESFSFAAVARCHLAAAATDLASPLRAGEKDPALASLLRAGEEGPALASPLRAGEEDPALASPLRAGEEGPASPLRAGEEDPALASLLRAEEEERALVRIGECEHKLVEATRLLTFAISALGTVGILSFRCMSSDAAAEVRAWAGARAARERARDAYDAVASSRGHLGAARRLVPFGDIAYHAADDEREAALAAIEAALGILLVMDAFRSSDDGVPDVALPRANSRPRSAAVPAKLIGAEGATSSTDKWRSLGGFVPDALLRVALSGAVREIEMAQAALRLGADAVDKESKVAAPLDHSSAVDWPSCYTACIRAFDAAHDVLSGLLAINREAGIVFLYCAPQLGPARVGKGWRSSDSMAVSRADTERHGRAALDGLWEAAALLDYVFAGVMVWGSTSSCWEEARQAMRRALIETNEARDAGEQLRHAASREFFHAACAVFQFD